MLSNIYALYDLKALNYSNPFYAVNDALALRMTIDAASSPDTLLNLHPADFQLFRIGEYDNESGCIRSDLNLHSLGKVDQILNKEQNHGTA